jgi:DNA polymerase epsilon subunit 1
MCLWEMVLHYFSFISFITLNYIQGIYETKIPPDLNAVLQIGCVCKVDKSAKKRSIQDGWDLAELQMKTTAECSYLEQTVSFFYLYHRYP